MQNVSVATGDIKAISNLERNPYGPGYVEALNRAVMGYEPGSVVKTLSMMIAVEDGIVRNLNEELPTGNGWSYAGGRAITDSHYTSSIRVGEVLEQSSNIGMARIITRRYDSIPAGWYMPSIAELCKIYQNREAVNNSLQHIYRLDEQAAMNGLETNWYWSASQAASSDDYAWFVHYFNGYAGECPKNFTNVHALAVRAF